MLRKTAATSNSIETNHLIFNGTNFTITKAKRIATATAAKIITIKFIVFRFLSIMNQQTNMLNSMLVTINGYIDILNFSQRKARSGEIKMFTGISDPYEAPTNPDIECRTDLEELNESVNKVFAQLKDLGYLSETITV